MNQDDAVSKTSLPRTWGIPNVTKAISEKYSKGQLIESLFQKTGTKRKRKEVTKMAVVEKAKVVKKAKVLNKPKLVPCLLNSSLLEKIPSSLQLILKTEEKSPEEKIAELKAREKKDRAMKSMKAPDIDLIKEQIFSDSEYPVYSCEENLYQDFYDLIYFNENVTIQKKEAIEICKDTVTQSNCEKWFEIRDYRISATKAHKIKARRKEINDKFLNELMSRIELQGIAQKNVLYGLKYEKTARDEFRSRLKRKNNNAKVIEVKSYHYYLFNGT